MSRRHRQRNELRELCDSGGLSRAGDIARLSRAVDLAFEHFADFGRDDDILRLLADTIERTAAPAGVRRRFAELRVGAGSGPAV
jgi:hypothetical protein